MFVSHRVAFKIKLNPAVPTYDTVLRDKTIDVYEYVGHGMSTYTQFYDVHALKQTKPPNKNLYNYTQNTHADSVYYENHSLPSSRMRST